MTGDGCFLMTAMEISTAARECLPVKFFILDDQAYHYMQVLQEKAYRRTTATILARLDYAALAKGFGVEYMEIDSDRDLEGGIRAALEQPGPVLTRVVTDYGKRPIRWLDAVRSRYVDGLTTEQKVRFLARLGSRALEFRSAERLSDAAIPGENPVASSLAARTLEKVEGRVEGPFLRNTIRFPPVSASLSVGQGGPETPSPNRAAPRRPRRGVSFMGADDSSSPICLLPLHGLSFARPEPS